MAKKIHNVSGITVEKDGMRLELGTDRLNRNLNNAQYELDSAIMKSMKPLMPMRDSNFIKRVIAENASRAGTGEVYAAVGPEGRYLYEGKTMVDEKTGSPWARKDARKVLVSQYAGKTNAKPNLTYSRGQQSHWFEKAKERDSSEWQRVVNEEMEK